MKRLSSGRVHLAMHCLSALRDDMGWKDKPARSIRVGLARHDVLEGYPTVPDLQTVARRRDLRPGELRELSDSLGYVLPWIRPRWRASWRHEVAIALNVSSSPVVVEDRDKSTRTLGPGETYIFQGRGRPPSTPEGVIVSVADVLDERAPIVHVVDFKSPGWTKHPRDSWQMKTLAVSAARATGAESILCTVVKLYRDRDPYDMPHVFDGFDLDVSFDELADLAARAAEEETHEARPNAGPWCDEAWCGCRATCPAYAAMQRNAGAA